MKYNSRSLLICLLAMLLAMVGLMGGQLESGDFANIICSALLAYGAKRSVDSVRGNPH